METFQGIQNASLSIIIDKLRSMLLPAHFLQLVENDHRLSPETFQAERMQRWKLGTTTTRQESLEAKSNANFSTLTVGFMKSASLRAVSKNRDSYFVQGKTKENAKLERNLHIITIVRQFVSMETQESNHVHSP